MKAEAQDREEERLAALHGYGITGAERELAFDDIVGLVARLCDARVAVSTCSAGTGKVQGRRSLGTRSTPLDSSICAHVILGSDFGENEDLTLSRDRRRTPGR